MIYFTLAKGLHTTELKCHLTLILPKGDILKVVCWHMCFAVYIFFNLMLKKTVWSLWVSLSVYMFVGSTALAAV